MLRIGITALFVAIACGVIALAFRAGAETSWGGLWLNLGTEIIGIALTVAIVEWLFERRRLQDEARKMAWRVLHELDHAVWVWQGGHREFDLSELLALLALADDSDPVPDFTQNLLMHLGSKSQDTLRHEPDVPRAKPQLERAPSSLAPLARIRDNQNLLPGSQISAHLREAAHDLAGALKIHVPDTLPSMAALRDTDAQKQEWRHFGKVLGA